MRSAAVWRVMAGVVLGAAIAAAGCGGGEPAEAGDEPRDVTLTVVNRTGGAVSDVIVTGGNTASYGRIAGGAREKLAGGDAVPDRAEVHWTDAAGRRHYKTVGVRAAVGAGYRGPVVFTLMPNQSVEVARD